MNLQEAALLIAIIALAVGPVVFSGKKKGCGGCHGCCGGCGGAKRKISATKE